MPSIEIARDLNVGVNIVVLMSSDSDQAIDNTSDSMNISLLPDDNDIDLQCQPLKDFSDQILLANNSPSASEGNTPNIFSIKRPSVSKLIFALVFNSIKKQTKACVSSLLL